MARKFASGSSEYLEIDTPAVTASPYTFACWFNAPSITEDHTLLWVGDKDDVSQYGSLAARGKTAGDPVRFRFKESGVATDDVFTSTGFSADTWHHACGVEVSDTDRRVFIDGGSKGSGTTDLSVVNYDRTSIGRNGDSTPDGYSSAHIAEAAYWDVALSDAEVALLAKGYSPLFFPKNLVGYWPLIRDDDLDSVGDLNLTAFNTPTVAEHPPIIYPAPPFISYPVAAVGNAMPMAMDHYRRRRVAA